MTLRTQIELDVSAFNQQINEVKRQLGDLNSQVKGGDYRLNTEQAQRDVKQLTDALSRLEIIRDHALNQTGLKTNEVARVTQLFNQSAQAFERVNRQNGAAISPHEIEAQRAAALENEALAQTTHQGRVVSTSRQLVMAETQQRDSRLSQLTNVAASAAGAALGGGGIGSVAGSVAGGALGLLGGPLGMVGGLLGGAIGGKIDKSLDDVGKEAVSYHELRNSLGNASVDFDTLRAAVRGLTEGLGLTYQESVTLARQFAQTAASTPNAEDLGQSLQEAIQFARSYGIEPQAGVQFFAEQRLNGVVNNESDNRRLALQIAEAVARGGMSAKMTETLTAISQFTQHSAAQTLTTPDVSAFTSLLGTMTSSTVTGLSKNPSNAAQLITQADEGIKHLSSVQDKELFLSALQHGNPNVSALDAEALMEGGLFASPANTFGRNSPSYQLAEQLGDNRALQHYQQLSHDNTPSINRLFDEIIQRSTQQDGTINTTFASKTVAQELKMGERQAAALLNLHLQDRSQGFGELESKLGDYGLDLSTLKMPQIGAAAELLVGDTTANFNKQYQHLQDSGVISRQEKPALDTLAQQDPAAFRQTVLKLTLDNAKDDGEKSRDATTSLARDMNKLVTDLLPYTLAIKEGVTEIVRFFADVTGNDKAQKFVDEQAIIDKASDHGLSLSGKNDQGEPLSTAKRQTSAAELMTVYRHVETAKAADVPFDPSGELNTLAQKSAEHPSDYPSEYPQLLQQARQDFGLAADKNALNQFAHAHGIQLSGQNTQGEPLADSAIALTNDRFAKARQDPRLRLDLAQYYQAHPEQQPKEYPQLLHALHAEQGVANTTPIGEGNQRYALELTGITQSGQALTNANETSAALQPYLEHFTGQQQRFADTKAFQRQLGIDRTQAQMHPGHYDAAVLPYLDYFERHYHELQSHPETAHAQFKSEFAVAPELPPIIDTPPEAPVKRATQAPRGGESHLPAARLPESGKPNHPAAVEHWLNHPVPELSPHADIKQSPLYQKLDAEQRENADLIITENAKQGHPERAHYWLGLAMQESSLRHSASAVITDRNGQAVDTATGLFQFTGNTARQEHIDPTDRLQNIRKAIELRNRDTDHFGSPQLAAAAHITGSNLNAYRRGEFPSDARVDQNGTSAKTEAAWMSYYAAQFLPQPSSSAVPQAPVNREQVEEPAAELPSAVPLEDLRIKSPEAVTGGAVEPGTVDLARLIQGRYNDAIKQFSAFNDRWHQQHAPDSAHTKGLKFDVSLTHPRQAEAMKARIEALGQHAGVPIKVRNEYANASAQATGGHLDVGFNTAIDAARFSAVMKHWETPKDTAKAPRRQTLPATIKPPKSLPPTIKPNKPLPPAPLNTEPHRAPLPPPYAPQPAPDSLSALSPPETHTEGESFQALMPPSLSPTDPAQLDMLQPIKDAPEDPSQPLAALAKEREAERERLIKIKHAPLSLDITLRDPHGQPLTDRLIASQFGHPKPHGIA